MSKTENDSMSRREFLNLTKLALGAGALGYVPEWLRRTIPYIASGDRNSNKVAITIDDGWYPDKVEQAMAYLSGVPASFFIVGTVMQASPDLYRSAIDSGVEIHNHTWDHRYLNAEGVNVNDEIVGWENAYLKLDRGVYKNKVLRAPANEGINDPDVYGALDYHGYSALLGWTYGSPGVYSRYTSTDVVNFVLPKLLGGDIILMHFTPADIEALPEIVKGIKDKGLEPVGLTGLPGIPIYIDTRRSTPRYLPR